MTPAGRTVRVAANGPFDHRAALTMIALHAIDGLDHVDVARGTLTRVVELDGHPVPATVTLDPGGATLTADSPGTGPAAARLLTHWFDLSTDLAPVNDHLAADPLLREQVAARPGIRITRYASSFEAALRVVLAQQVSLAAARLFGSRLVAAFGEPITGPGGKVLQRFPTPGQIAAVPTAQLRAQLRLTGSRARTVTDVAQLFAAHTAAGTAPGPGQLSLVHGIGPWTLQCLAIRGDTDPDSFPGSDAVLRRILRASTGHPTAQPDAWRPYRSYAATRLWTSASGQP